MSVKTGANVSVSGRTKDEASEAYTRFFDREGSQLLRLSYLLLGDLADAEDVAQEVLEELYRKWGGLRQESVMAYARTAVLNRSRSLQRRRSVARRFAPRLAQAEEAAPAGLEDRELWELVQSLPRRQREVVVLRYWCDLSEAEIARVLGISAGTVKSSVHRAHSSLATTLADTGSIERPRKDMQ